MQIQQDPAPIILIEDDREDQFIFELAFQELGIKNKIITFDDGELALDYFIKTDDHPFLIICDINIPKINGIDIRKMILKEPSLRRRFIPFIYFSTSYHKDLVDQAQELSVQGFFLKEAQYSELKGTIKMIVDYWTKCKFLILW